MIEGNASNTWVYLMSSSMIYSWFELYYNSIFHFHIYKYFIFYWLCNLLLCVTMCYKHTQLYLQLSLVFLVDCRLERICTLLWWVQSLVRGWTEQERTSEWGSASPSVHWSCGGVIRLELWKSLEMGKVDMSCCCWFLLSMSKLSYIKQSSALLLGPR